MRDYIIFYNDTNMQNGSNGGGGPGQPILQVVQPARVKEVGTLVPQTALEVAPAQPAKLTLPK